MGKPSCTYFCENGHLVEQSGESIFLEFEMYDENCPPCEICKSNKIRLVTEWGYEGYKSKVPIKPIRFDEFQQTDFKGNIYYTQTAIYNITKLFKEDYGK